MFTTETIIAINANPVILTLSFGMNERLDLKASDLLACKTGDKFTVGDSNSCRSGSHSLTVLYRTDASIFAEIRYVYNDCNGEDKDEVIFKCFSLV